MRDNTFKPKGFAVWIVCALFFLYEFLLRTVIGTYQHPVMADLNLTSFEFSLLSSTIFLAIYGAMQIPAGLIVDNFGLKKSLLLGAVTCTVASFGIAYAHSYALAITCRMLMGFGAAFGFLGLLISVHDWMPRRYSAIFIGLSQFIGTLGPMGAAGPLEALSESSSISWRFIFMCLGAVGALISTLILFVVENNQQTTGKYAILYKPESIAVSLKRLFVRSQPIYIAILCSSLYFTVEYLSENEGRAFLMLRGISATSASYMLTIAWLGYAIGCPLLGFLSDVLHRRKSLMVTASVLGLLAILTILYVPYVFAIQAAFFCLGVSASGQSIGFATMAEQFKKQFVAVGFGMNNAMITTLAAINAPIIGWFLDCSKEGTCLTIRNYQDVFIILIGLAVIAVVVSILFVKETYCKSVVEFTYLKHKA